LEAAVEPTHPKALVVDQYARSRWNHSSNGHHQRMSVSVVEPIATFSCSRTCVRIYSYDLVR
jgi:hypothetical protein